ncbi:MAG: ABC-F family ATP-binding cassette domain-containing protein [Bdellovibrionales bacterium]
MILLQADGLTKKFGARVLFDQVNFSLSSDQKIALIGKNGTGKTSLFRCIENESEITEGVLHRKKNLLVGYLKQETRDEILGFTPEQYLSQIHEEIWTAKSEGTKLGLNEAHFETLLSDLSGGYRMRVFLLNEILKKPDLLLLDEPTNYLDIESIIILEKFLIDYKGSFILISHDREFLKNTCDYIMEIDQQKISTQKLKIDEYFAWKQEVEILKQKNQEKVLREQSQIMDFANRFRAKASKAKQVQSRLKRLDKLPSISNMSIGPIVKIPVAPTISSGKLLKTSKSVELGYDEKVILKNVDLQISRGEKIGILGINGAGKSTLLKFLAGKLKPLAGSEEDSQNLEISYFAQHLTDSLDLKKDLVENLYLGAPKNSSDQKILDMAGSLGFRSEQFYKPIENFSGGEKTRVALGKCLLKPASLLILDEPTNHLDFETVESMSESLIQYDGAMVFVCHDRSFLERIANKIFLIQNSKLDVYPGNYQEYIWSLQNGSWANNNELTLEINSKSSAKKPKYTGNFKDEKKKLEKQKRNLSKNLEEIDKKVEKINKEITILTNTLNSPATEDTQTIALQLHELGSDLEEAEELWMVTTDKIEKIEQDLKSHFS